MVKVDKFQVVTDKLLTLLERGVKPWVKPWHGAGYRSIDGLEYSGVNPLLCAMDCMVAGYESSVFAGFHAGKDKGWKLKKGAKATYITYCKFVETGEKEGEKESGYFFRKWIPVFNGDLWDDSESELKKEEVVHENTISTLPKMESFVAAQNATVTASNHAFYSPSKDAIGIPSIHAFTSSNAYYATLVHELSHWTGHESRLNRKQSGKFGSNDYAFEELIAEIGAAFVCSQYGIDSEIENHASYLDNWIQVLKGDNTAFLKAASAAQKSAALLLKNAGIE